jgi:[ribosomal protein S5]-alanine N-acetyltransferase
VTNEVADEATNAPRATVPDLAALALEIHTPRLHLRPIAEGDVDGLWPHVSDPEVPRWMSWLPHANKDETLAYVRAEARALASSTGIVWVISVAGNLMGTIGLRRLQWHLRSWRVDRGDLGYWLAASQWNQGLMTEAARAVVRFGFTALGLHKITSGCLVDNVGSRRVIEKLGFTQVGVQAAEAWVAGAWRDHLLYELLASSWSSTQGG